MDIRKGKGRRIAAGFLGGCVIVGIFAGQRINAYAILDESDAVKFAAFSADNTIEDGTLFIGTYLIQMSAMTDELYEKARTSAEDSGQYNIYYKSELAEGTWFDISSAEGLAAITNDSEPADASEMAELWVTYYAGADGIVRSASSGAAVNIFDQPSPYDLYHLAELESLRIQYDNNFPGDSTGVKKYYHDKLAEFFALDLQNSITNECDAQLAALQTVYEQMKQQEKEEQAEIVYTLMGRIDARRRAEIFYQLMEAEDSRLNRLQTVLGGSGYAKGDYDDEQYTQNADLSDALGNAMESCEASYISHSGNQLEDDGTVLGSTEYELSMQILDSAAGGNTGLEQELTGLKHLYSIRDSVIKDKTAELELLEQELLPKAQSKFTDLITGGAGQEYATALSQGKSNAALEKILEIQQTKQDQALTEYQFLIQAKTDRMGSSEALDYVYDRIGEAGNLYGQVRGDDYTNYANSGIDSYLQMMKELAQKIIDNDSSLKSRLSELEEEKAATKVLRDSALDNNDLAEAKKYDAMLEAIDAEIAAQEQKLADQLKNGSTLDKAKAATQLGQKTEAANIEKLKNNAKNRLSDGDTNGILEAAEALAALGAEDALNDLMQNLPPGTSDTIKNGLKSALDQAGAEGDPAKDSFGSSEEDLLAQLEVLMGGAFDSLAEGDKVIVISALNRFGTAGSEAGASLAKQLTLQCAEENNRYIYAQYSGSAGQMANTAVSAATLGRVTGYRYIYTASKKNATLSKRGKTYSFTVGSRELKFSDQSVEMMSDSTALQGSNVYLPQDAVSRYFDCTSEVITGTGYAFCLTDVMNTSADELLESLKGGE